MGSPCYRSDQEKTLTGLVLTVILAVIFTAFQALEYYTSPFTISDSVYGATFFLATGFHGFHVIIGTIFLTVCTIKINLSSFYS